MDGGFTQCTFFAYADNYLIDVKCGVIMDVEATRAIRQAEVGASQTMIERTETCFGIKPDWLVADAAYGAAPNLNWLVNEKAIAPHIPVFNKSKRQDGTFSREDFTYDKERDIYICPAGKTLKTTGTPSSMTVRRCSTGPALTIAARVRSNPSAVQTCPFARCHAISMKRPAMWPVPSLKPKPMRKPAVTAKRSRYSLLISNAISGLVVSGCAARSLSSPLPPLPRTSGVSVN